MVSLDDLNPEQKRAAQTVEGPLLILAGAGSGKTRTLTYRIAHMIEGRYINPAHILAISFTNKAARELKERMNKLIGTRDCRDLTLCTFHALGVQILRQEIEKLGYRKQFNIYDTSDQLSIIREALKNFKGDKKFDKKAILSKIGFLKNKGISAEEFATSAYYDQEEVYDFVTEYAFRYYEEKMRFYNVIDFDDILNLCVKLFREYPEVANKYSQKYQFIMIDEYQDTNPLQLEMVKALTSTHKNICVVGDDDQSIYGFRGADIKNILEFERQYQGCRVIKLEQNYRSTTPILNLANKVIQENKNRKDKTMWSDDQTSQRPFLWAMGDTDHEAAVVVDDIAKYMKEGGSLNEVAILYRSNTQFPAFEEELRLANIPYQVIGGQKFYEKKEIKDLIAYLSLIHNQYDEMSLRRIINVPQRGIGQATLKTFIDLATQDQTSIFRAIEKHPQSSPKKAHALSLFTSTIRRFQGVFKNKSLSVALEELIEDINFHSWVDKQYDHPGQLARKKNEVDQFVEAAKRFEKYVKGDSGLKDFLEKVLLQDNQDQQELEETTEINEVTLMTLHSSKGLEFDQVYLIGMEEEYLPHKKTITLGEDVSEERRLAYVGITRARKKLVMTYCKERTLYGKKSPRFKSRFIHQLTDLFIEQDRTNFGHLSQEEAQEYKKNFLADLMSQLDV